MPASGLTPPRFKRLPVAAALLIAGAMGMCLHGIAVRGEEPLASSAQPIVLAADYSQEWSDGGPVMLLRGHCRIDQGDVTLTAQKMVIWHAEDENGGHRLTVYLEDEVRVDRPENSIAAPSKLVVLTSTAGLQHRIQRRVDDETAGQDPLYRRAVKRRGGEPRSELQRTQFQVIPPGSIPPESLPPGATPPGAFPPGSIPPGEGPVLPGAAPPAATPTPPNLRRVRIYPRSAVNYNVLSYQNTNTTPPEQISVLSGGITVIVEGAQRDGQQFGPIDLSADRMVIWTQLQNTDGLSTDSLQLRDTPFQVYMEGNIIIRQGENVIKASQAVYDAREDRGLMLNAEVRSFVPQLQGDLRVRAERVRMLSRKKYQARNAWITGSQYGRPGYRVQASELFLDYRPAQPWLGVGQPAVDPITGMAREVPWVTSLDNTFYLEEAPVFYLPQVSGPAEDPNIPIRSASVQQDRIFGTQIRITWDGFKLLGIPEPRDAQWDIFTNYLSERGPAIGTGGKYAGRDAFGVPGRYFGSGLAIYQYDEGKDNLGSDRKSLEPETDNRYRLTFNHRHEFPNQLFLFGEIGLLSDRNFLEQYYENEFDRQKDIETLLYGKQYLDNLAWSALVRPQTTPFENTTEWLPRGDLFLLSEPLLGGRLTWSSHTSAGYARLRPADAPDDSNDLFVPLPYVTDSEGAVLMSRHGLDAPFNLGPLNITPFVMGEGAFWSEDFTGNSIDRFVGQAGVRSSILFWRVYPNVRSDVFNLHGLAHKIRLEAEYALTDSSRDLDDIPQYNEFDDNAQERFRQRFPVNTFGGMVPPIFEPRFYAVRTGAGSWITAPYHELVDDQQVVRLALRQRLQTKVGPPDRLRIKDWMTLDLEGAVFPNPSRDNFGEGIGLLSARYMWSLSDRTSLFANALYDTFDGGQEQWNLGVQTQRGERGSLYLGLRQVKGGPLDSQIATASYTYRMSPKWISTLGTAYDLNEGRNVGQSLTITRVGADFLVHVGANYDQSKGNAGFAISVEPRFGGFRSGQNPDLSNLLNAPR